MDITFNCPKCDQELVVDASYAGEQIECPECSAEIIVPDAEDAVESETDETEERENEDSSETDEEEEDTEQKKPTPVKTGGVINAMASSAAARENKVFSVPVHEGPTEEKLIQKPQTPLSITSKRWEKGVAIKTIRRIDCMEVGKDRFDEKVTEFINTIGYERVLEVQTMNYTAQDLATKALMTDFGVLILYRIPEE